MNQVNTEPHAGESLRDRFRATATDFSRNVEEAAGRLGAAADQLMSITEVFVAAGERLEQALESHRQVGRESQEAVSSSRSAAIDARTAADRAVEAQRATETLQARLEGSYAELAGLIRDLQERIGALAVLARPLPAEPHYAAPAAPSPAPAVAAAPGVWPGSGWTPESLQQSDS